MPNSLGAGWSSPVARQAHNLKAAGSNPAPATKHTCNSIHSCSRSASKASQPHRNFVLSANDLNSPAELLRPNSADCSLRSSRETSRHASRAARMAARRPWIVNSADLPSADGAITTFCTSCRAIDIQPSSTPFSRVDTIALTADSPLLSMPTLRGWVTSGADEEGTAANCAATVSLIFQFIEHVIQGRDGGVSGHETFGDLFTDRLLLGFDRLDLATEPFWSRRCFRLVSSATGDLMKLQLADYRIYPATAITVH